MSDKILITEDALAETIRCALCHNSNKTERGCDGACQYDKELHAKIVEAVEGIAEQRPHGEWVKRSDGSYKCPFCCYSDWSTSNFCPNCGASMSANDRQVTSKLNEEAKDSHAEYWNSIGEWKGGEAE